MSVRRAPFGGAAAFALFGSTLGITAGAFLAFGLQAAAAARTTTTGGGEGAGESGVTVFSV